jgi:NAD(P)H-dependent FMN reductase
MFDGLARLPAFNPDNDRDPLHLEVQGLRHAIHETDAILFSTPEYAGSLPGSLKNLLDWTIGDDQNGSVAEKPVGWLNASTRGAAGAHDELRTVLRYAHARVVESACVQIPVTTDMITPDGLVELGASRAVLARILPTLVGPLEQS